MSWRISSHVRGMLDHLVKKVKKKKKPYLVVTSTSVVPVVTSYMHIISNLIELNSFFYFFVYFFNS